MAKNSIKSMKTDESKVLDVLRTNAKVNVNDLGKRCGFSPQKVARIIKNLEKQKRIWGYTAIEDGEVNELKHFILLVHRSMMPLDVGIKKEGIIEKCLSEFMNIEDIYLTHGIYDYIFTFYASDIIYAKKFIQELSSKLGKYFDTYLLLETLFPIRKQGFKNPQIEKLVDYL